MMIIFQYPTPDVIYYVLPQRSSYFPDRVCYFIGRKFSISSLLMLFYLGEALNIDLKDFYTSFYALLFPLALNPNMEDRGNMSGINAQKSKLARSEGTDTELEMLMKGFDFMLFKRRQVTFRCSRTCIVTCIVIHLLYNG
jgi:hypothetical protein